MVYSYKRDRENDLTKLQFPTTNSHTATNAALGKNSARVNRRMGLPETLLWVVIGASLSLGLAFSRPPGLSNDSYQYLSVAENLAKGSGIETSLVHFDSERSEGRIPAPMTTFAPGYPIAIALSSVVAGNIEQGARLLSIMAFALLPLLVRALAEFAGLNRGATRLAIALLFTNAYCLHASTQVLSEPLFLLTSLTGLLLIAKSRVCSSGEWGWSQRLIIGQILVGVSYSVRYAGILVFAAVFLHAAFLFARLRNRQSLIYLLSNAISGSLIAAIMLRNFVLVGSWKGGNEKQFANPIRSVLDKYLSAQIHLLFGMHAVDFWTISVAAILAAAVLWGTLTMQRSRMRKAPLLTSGDTLLFAYGFLSTAALIYLGSTSDISFGVRMFYPLLPLYLVGALRIIQSGSIRSFGGWKGLHLRQAMALLFVALYAWANLREFSVRREPTPIKSLQTSFGKDMSNGQPLREWVDTHIGKDEAIAADYGQATGYFLRRPTVSLVESQYSSIQWDQGTLTRQMIRFHARFLILHLNLRASEDPVRVESKFLAQAICCRIHPGFHLAAENAEIRILEVDGK